MLNSFLVSEMPCLTRWPLANVDEDKAPFSEQGRSSRAGPPGWIKSAPRLTGPDVYPYQPHHLSFPIIVIQIRPCCKTSLSLHLGESGVAEIT